MAQGCSAIFLAKDIKYYKSSSGALSVLHFHIILESKRKIIEIVTVAIGALSPMWAVVNLQQNHTAMVSVCVCVCVCVCVFVCLVKNQIISP
jgi:VIT1/CCC1 family predicted Fe2+/Mn2+ transporter